MKNFIVQGLFILILFPLCLNGQENFEFSYDNAGNRTNRTISLKKGASESKGESAMQAYRPLEDKTFNDISIKLYPNPTKGCIYLEMNGMEGPINNLSIQVFDFNGRKIIEKKDFQDRTEIDLENRPDGIYFLMLKQGSSVSRWKIIKEQ